MNRLDHILGIGSAPAAAPQPAFRMQSQPVIRAMQELQNDLAKDFLKLGQRRITIGSKLEELASAKAICQAKVDRARVRLEHCQRQLSASKKRRQDLELVQKGIDIELEKMDRELAVLAGGSASHDEEPAPASISPVQKPLRTVEEIVLQDFFSPGTQVIYSGQKRIIQGHTEKGEFLLAPVKGEVNPTAVPKAKLTYRPKAGDICLIREDRKADPDLRYYKVKILEVLPVTKSFFLRLKFNWLDYNENEERQFRGIGAVVPLLSKNDARLNTLRQDIVINDSMGTEGTGYYMQRKE